MRVGAPGRHRTRAATWLLLLCIGYPACAQVYRWRDEQGRVHYGDRPPAGVAAERLDPDPVPAVDDGSPDRRMQRERVLEVLGEERKEREEARAAERAAMQERREKCEQARRELQEVRDATYLYEPGSDPANPRVLSDAERAAYTRDAERAVERWCGS